MGFPLDMAPVLFAIPRAAGWLAHWCEALEAEEQRIFRPRQMYVGPEARQYVPLAQRQTKEGTMHRMEAFVSNSSKRREAGFDGDTPLSKEKLS
jgi:citrate synthase